MDKDYEKKRKIIGEILKAERLSKVYDQEKLAKILGVNQACISKTEKGARKMDVVQLMEYCNALGITLTELSVKIDNRFWTEFPEYRTGKDATILKSFTLPILQLCIRLMKNLNYLSVFALMTIL